MDRKQKLELTWIGKANRPKLEPRILIEEPEHSYHAAHRVTDHDIFDNRLIYGDNLLALKALEQEFTGRIQCVYIDPPFNTDQAFEHYDDGLEHSAWLSLMYERLLLLHRLLCPTGSLFIHIDDNELGYLIAVADEIFGRNNRVSVIPFKQSAASGPKAINPGVVTTTNFVLFYAKDKERWRCNKLYVPTTRDDRYSKFIDKFEGGPEHWRLVGLREAFLKAERLEDWNAARQRFMDRLEARLEAFVLAHADRVVRTARVAQKDVNEAARQALNTSIQVPGRVTSSRREEKDDYYFLNGEQLIFYRSKTRTIDGKTTTASPLTNLWDDLLSNNLHAEGGVSFPNGKKPEALIKRVLELTTQPGEWVLDSFAGSGTTGAVAHKMGRKWVMVELGAHAYTHIVPRLKRVVDAADPSGVTQATEWSGGGGFRTYRLAPSLLERDNWGNWIINKEYNGAMLAEALCKLEGFLYIPSETVYWQHGHSTERDFIYVTTQHLTHEQLLQMSEDVGSDCTLLVMCTAFRGKAEAYPNLTIKKIPRTVLSRCEWGRDDYSLEVANLPPAPSPVGQQGLAYQER